MTDLEPIEQKQFDFYNSQITAVLTSDHGRENVYVVLRPLVESLGLSWSSQRNRIKRNTILDEVCTTVFIMNTEGDTVKRRKMLCLPLSHLNGFLFGVEASRVKESLRPLLEEYQRNCYRILFEAFNTVDSMRRFYSALGHDEGWIGTRIEKHSMVTDLSHLWLERGVSIEFHEQLQSLINEGAFGITIAEHKRYKGIPETANLQDNMTRAELIISMLGDEATRRIADNEAATGLEENEAAAKAGGKIAGLNRELFEEQTNSKILSQRNYLDRQKQIAPDAEKEQE